MHAPAYFRGGPKPLVDADTSVSDSTRFQGFEADAQLSRSGPNLLAGKFVGPAGRARTKVRKTDAEFHESFILFRSVESFGNASGVQDAPEAVAGMGVVVAGVAGA